MGFSREGAPEPPAKGRRSAGALQKRGLRDILKAIPTSAYSCGFRMKRASATRAGGVTGGGAGASVPPGRVGYQWAYIFSAVRPDTGDDVTLVMPSVNAKVMDLFSHTSPILDQDAHAVMMCDGAGWHDERALTVPDTPWRCCRLTVPNSTPSSGFGSTYANASYRSASSTTPRPSSTPVAKHGSTSSQNRIVCEPSAPIHGS